MVVLRCQCSQWQPQGRTTARALRSLSSTPHFFKAQIKPRACPPLLLHLHKSTLHPATSLLVILMMHTGRKSRAHARVCVCISSRYIHFKYNRLTFLQWECFFIYFHGSGISFFLHTGDNWVTALLMFTPLHRPVSMAPQMAQPAHSAGQMLTQMSRQNGAPQSVAPSSTGSPLHGGPAGGWAASGTGPRPQFNNQVTTTVRHDCCNFDSFIGETEYF